MTFSERAIGAVKLDVRTFEDVEADRGATTQALAVVVLSSLAGGLGLNFGAFDAPVIQRIVIALIAWVLWGGLTYVIGVYVMPEPQTRTSIGELLRTIGFAAAPGILRVFGPVPGIGRLIYGVATFWMVVAMVVAIRQSLDYKSTARAIVVCVLAGLIPLLALFFGAVILVMIESVFLRPT